MRKLTFLLACLFLASVGLVNAQSRTVTGRVIYAEDEQPVIGAYVVVQGSSRGTVTDADGNFSISVPQEATILEFSFLGMKTVQAEARNGMVVRMEQEVSELDEVMVVAFGTATKKSFTGSAAVIKAEDITTRQVSNVTNALAGQVAGVQTVNTSGGQPGNAATIRIRGIGSMSASNAPLYIVDGAPFDGSMSSINPQDIESISVLKDAAANAIYGARGANGVVLITTKRGTTQEAKVNVDAKWGNNSRAVPNYAVMEDPAMYYETFYKALYNSKIYNGNSANDAHVYARSVLFDKDAGGLGYQVYTVPAGQSLIGTNFKLNPNATLGYKDADFYYTPDNWYNEIFDPNNLRQEYNVSVSGASDKINYFMSLGYLDDSGIVSGSGFSRYTARTNVEYQAKEWLKVGANIGYTNYDIQSPGSQTNWGSSGNLFYVTSLIAPIYPL
ncbi:MAG: SusC/RagA family TonB-linked outer membrane protein, partial [Bacteroidales bacterium]|nr:SusC/RagA family TonB-linked outer membrane protein [Bacteroidales bacterium]